MPVPPAERPSRRAGTDAGKLPPEQPSSYKTRNTGRDSFSEPSHCPARGPERVGEPPAPQIDLDRRADPFVMLDFGSLGFATLVSHFFKGVSVPRKLEFSWMVQGFS